MRRRKKRGKRMKRERKRERRQTQLKLALDDDKPSGERHSTEAQRGKTQAGKNGKAGQGMICRGNEEDDGDERRDERKRKGREETREKTGESTGEAEKREAGRGCVGGGAPPEQRSINGQPCAFSRVYGCCVSGRCFFLPCSSCLILRLLAGTVCHHSPGELVAGRGYVIAIAARSGKREAVGVISVSRADYVILVWQIWTRLANHRILTM